MTDVSKSTAGAAIESGSAHLGLTREMLMMTRVIFASPVGKALTMLVASLVLVISATAYGQIRLNRWNKPFFDALSRRDLRDFLFELG
ncbi:MAG: vitamin B12/bleomycin/antimicrobial peptide transport system ATP-binding/permease protein, partial [Gammaproteobacteria bacterium]|nr:vitamin B12/bleomycin/antimicrobial peptide transport system ATP-binding/permease protein [Gammaproteobacteria bacterium]